jgi:hypothetical protein
LISPDTIPIAPVVDIGADLARHPNNKQSAKPGLLLVAFFSLWTIFDSGRKLG